jgi:hypothetical protein
MRVQIPCCAFLKPRPGPEKNTCERVDLFWEQATVTLQVFSTKTTLRQGRHRLRFALRRAFPLCNVGSDGGAGKLRPRASHCSTTGPGPARSDLNLVSTSLGLQRYCYEELRGRALGVGRSNRRNALHQCREFHPFPKRVVYGRSTQYFMLPRTSVRVSKRQVE